MDQHSRARGAGMYLLELAATARLRRLQAPTPGVPGAVTVAVVAVGPEARTDRLVVTAISATRPDSTHPVIRLHADRQDRAGVDPDVVDWGELATELDHLHTLGLPGDCPVQVTVGCDAGDRCETVRLLGVAERPDPALICLRRPRNTGRTWPACRHPNHRTHPPRPSLPRAMSTDTLFAGLLEVDTAADTAPVTPRTAAGPSSDEPPESADMDALPRSLARLRRAWSHVRDEADYQAALRRLNRVLGQVAALAGVSAPSALTLPQARYVDLPAVVRGLTRVEQASGPAHGLDERARRRAVWSELALVTACFKDGPLLRLPR